MKCSVEREPTVPPRSDKRQWTTAPHPAETLVIYTLTLADPGRSCPEATDSIEEIRFTDGNPDRTVQLG